jgi:hypothetical protein
MDVPIQLAIATLVMDEPLRVETGISLIHGLSFEMQSTTG